MRTHHGLTRDRDAVIAGLSLPYSSGRVEGTGSGCGARGWWVSGMVVGRLVASDDVVSGYPAQWASGLYAAEIGALAEVGCVNRSYGFQIADKGTLW